MTISDAIEAAACRRDQRRFRSSLGHSAIRYSGNAPIYRFLSSWTGIIRSVVEKPEKLGWLGLARTALEEACRRFHWHRGIALQKGDIFITDSRQELALDLERPWRHLLVTLPTQWIDSRATRPDLPSGAVLHDHPLARLWVSYLTSGFMLSGDLSPAAGALFARHSVDLLAQLLEEAHCDQPAPSDAVRAAIFQNACHLITLKFGDPSLAPVRIAQELKGSTRTLARIFAANNETVMQRVLDERIRQAARLLAMPEAFHRSVTEIAFACGFNDASHFGRVFAAKMHMTPSQWRQRKH